MAIWEILLLAGIVHASKKSMAISESLWQAGRVYFKQGESIQAGRVYEMQGDSMTSR